MSEASVDYSIVIPVYYNEGCLRPLIDALMEKVVRANPNRSAEIIFVDDGSGDNSLAELQEIQRQLPGIVTIVKLTRNFGQASALLAGYTFVRGQCGITMSADGQEPPELINQMLSAFFDEGFELVICAREGRDESRYRILTSKLFYYLMRRLTFKEMPKGGFDFWLISRRALEGLLRNADVNPFIQGYVLWMGFKTKILTYHRRERLAGVSKFTFIKKLNGLLAGVLQFSFAPIRAMSLAGCVFALLGFIYAGAIVVDRLILGNRTPIQGWAPLMIMILVMGGFQMVMLGVIGEYVWRTLAQVRHRDMYIIDHVARAGEERAILAERQAPQIASSRL